MSKAVENLEAAQKRAMAIRPQVGGFPHFAETLRRAGVNRNVWFLPACQSLFFTDDGPVVMQGTPLASGTMDVPPFNREALISALRTDQAGKSTFPEFLAASWRLWSSIRTEFCSRAIRKLAAPRLQIPSGQSFSTASSVCALQSVRIGRLRRQYTFLARRWESRSAGARR